MSVSPIIPPPPYEVPIMPIVPVLSGLDEESDWSAVEAYEDYVYSTAGDDVTISDDQLDKLMFDVRDLYDRCYDLYES